MSRSRWNMFVRQFGLIEAGWVADSAEADLLFMLVVMRSGAPSTAPGVVYCQ